MTHKETPLLDAIVRIDRLPATGRAIKVAPDAATREALAALLKLTAVEAFHAELTVVPLRGGLRARGRLTARIVQPSVVTFRIGHPGRRRAHRPGLPARSAEPQAHARLRSFRRSGR
ncbi:hypothetical protein N8D56_19425 [Devosia sp. A8/3-2]|nr:hypothetical protein N8D56_19425 [Devosia sp. A8/3-2]